MGILFGDVRKEFEQAIFACHHVAFAGGTSSGAIAFGQNHRIDRLLKNVIFAFRTFKPGFNIGA